jgi:hypothetical protein
VAEQNIVKAYRGPASGLPTLEAGQFGWTTDTNLLYVGTGAGNVLIGPGAGTGDVVGPPGATADHVAIYNGDTGKIIKDGGAFVIGTWFELDGNSDLEPATVFQSGLYFEVDVNGDAMPVA